jgi:hypothetical protein
VNLQQDHVSLAASLTAGCTDLHECSCDPACPIPFAEITSHVAGQTDSGAKHTRGGGAARGGEAAKSSVAWA